jgi:hypothetical protein
MAACAAIDGIDGERAIRPCRVMQELRDVPRKR